MMKVFLQVAYTTPARYFNKREKEVWSLLVLQHGITVQIFCDLSLAPEEFVDDTSKGSPLCGGLSFYTRRYIT